MPRLIRRQPLIERIKAYLNPLDFLLWLSEEIDSSDWDQFAKEWAIPLGVGLNIVFLMARANSSRNSSYAEDDVFGDDGGAPWLTWFASFVVHFLTLLSTCNAFYTFWRKRRYRMFEVPIDTIPSTPSARRVRLNSPQISVSPLQYLSNIMTSDAESRAPPDPKRDVWELAIWDPLPLTMRLFCLFSPGHVLVYWLFLPTRPSDPRPSSTIVITLFLVTLLSVQMSFLSSSYVQQAKDSTLLHKEVLNEYDTKFVHPRTQPLMRDVAVQFYGNHDKNIVSDRIHNTVETHTPVHIINRGFRTSPNPNYASHAESDKIPRPQTSSPWRESPPSSSPYVQTPCRLRDSSSPAIQGLTASIQQPRFKPPSTGDGGSLGVYSHANSPLRKSTSAYFDPRGQYGVDSGIRDRGYTPGKKQSNSMKQNSTVGGITPVTSPQRLGHRVTDM